MLSWTCLWSLSSRRQIAGLSYGELCLAPTGRGGYFHSCPCRRKKALPNQTLFPRGLGHDADTSQYPWPLVDRHICVLKVRYILHTGLDTSWFMFSLASRDKLLEYIHVFGFLIQTIYWSGKSTGLRNLEKLGFEVPPSPPLVDH